MTKRRRPSFDIPSEMNRRQISALLYSVEAVDSEYRTASAEHGEPDLVQEVNIDAWMRHADVSLILALADTGWGRYGLLPEVQADLYRHAQTHGERELWEPGDEDQIDDFCLRSDPDKNLRWLQQCRPGVYAAVVLMPYLGDAAPFGAAAEVDSHLVAAARICAPGFDPAVHVHRGTGDVAHDLLGTLPDASLAPAARPNDVGVNRDLSGKVVPLERRPKGP